jgi:hypothetical protein
VLAGHPDGSANIDVGVKPFIPLRVGQIVLLEQKKWKLLVIHSSKRLLVFSLYQYSYLNQSIQNNSIIWCVHGIPISILIHFVLEQMGTFTLDHRERLASMLDYIGIAFSEGAPIIAEVSFLRVSEFHWDLNICGKFALSNLLL